MWIAKPLRSLTTEEIASWQELVAHRMNADGDTPLAQSLAWASAIEAVGGSAFAVFSPEEHVGGLLFLTSSTHGGPSLECTNGPLLDWDTPRASAQLAMFATAASRLVPGLAKIVLRPRWPAEQTIRRLNGLPIDAASTMEAATLKMPLTQGPPEAPFSSRLRRTLKNNEKLGVTARWETLTSSSSSSLVEFALAAQAFGRARGFTVPPVFWFRALTSAESTLRFGLCSASDPSNKTGCQLLIAYHGSEAHYLFGHEWRAPDAPAALSPSAVAHHLALSEAAKAGMRAYDFNGYLENPPQDHPYAGVSQFKAQFGATIVRYRSPEFKIEV